MFFRTGYNYDVDAVSRETAVEFDPDESVTQQQFREEVDINTIVKRFGLTGQLPNGVNMPLSGEFTGVTDFHEAMNVVRQAEEAFAMLAPEVRERFGNDPGKVVAFLEDVGNRDEAIKLGMIPRPVERPRDAVQAIDELAAVLVPKP